MSGKIVPICVDQSLECKLCFKTWVGPYSDLCDFCKEKSSDYYPKIEKLGRRLSVMECAGVNRFPEIIRLMYEVMLELHETKNT